MQERGSAIMAIITEPKNYSRQGKKGMNMSIWGKKQRTTISISEDAIALLKAQAKEKGITVSELLERMARGIE